MKKLFASALVMASIGCGVEQQEEEAVGAGSTAVSHAALCSCPTIPPAPALPTRPTDLSTWLKSNGGRLVRAGVAVKSLYTITWQDPADSNRFIAAGYDVASRKVLFYVTANTKLEYGGFVRDFSNEVELNTANNPLYVGEGVLGAPKIGPRGPGGGFPWDPVFEAFTANNP